jgi:hypothetical protein
MKAMKPQTASQTTKQAKPSRCLGSWLRAHSRRGLSVAPPGCGLTTWTTGWRGKACKRSGSMLAAEWAQRFPLASITRRPAHGCRALAIAPTGEGDAAWPMCCTSCAPANQGRLPAWRIWHGSAASSAVWLCVVGAVCQPNSHPSSATNPSSCKRPVPARLAAAPQKCHTNQATPAKVTRASKSKSAFMPRIFT